MGPAMGSAGGGCGIASGGGTMGPAMVSGPATPAGTGRKRPRAEEEQADDDNRTVCAESDEEGSDTASSNVTIDLQRLQGDLEEEPAGNE